MFKSQIQIAAAAIGLGLMLASSGKAQTAMDPNGGLDLSMNGFVNGTDFAIMAANFNPASTGRDTGDFNYDGTVNGSDFAELAANFNEGASQSADQGSNIPSDVPEPASMGVLGIGALGLLKRRRARVV